ncbi:PREDICTED: serine/threonine-protein kinase ULK1-like [Priapulus caudatus]|uniref:Serine/threonine-protein kinase ULK1-like n=1 Tax=Priapulus caudatus TaxID=37621 RepID=A0ABM1EAD3_PRICU|nr:PREDICTED: serine/threonine-protein kinase ULK1-like [Priapulus caudatus]
MLMLLLLLAVLQCIEVDMVKVELPEAPPSPLGANTAPSSNASNASSPTHEDFVMVPADMQSDHSASSLTSRGSAKKLDSAACRSRSATPPVRTDVNVSPALGGAPSPKASSPPRPSNLHFNNSPPPSSAAAGAVVSAPIPVPSQVQNYVKMQSSSHFGSAPRIDAAAAAAAGPTHQVA